MTQAAQNLYDKALELTNVAFRPLLISLIIYVVLCFLESNPKILIRDEKNSSILEIVSKLKKFFLVPVLLFGISYLLGFISIITLRDTPNTSLTEPNSSNGAYLFTAAICLLLSVFCISKTIKWYRKLISKKKKYTAKAPLERHEASREEVPGKDDSYVVEKVTDTYYYSVDGKEYSLSKKRQNIRTISTDEIDIKTSNSAKQVHEATRKMESEIASRGILYNPNDPSDAIFDEADGDKSALGFMIWWSICFFAIAVFCVVKFLGLL